jgi:hypothetical protein
MSKVLSSILFLGVATVALTTTLNVARAQVAGWVSNQGPMDASTMAAILQQPVPSGAQLQQLPPEINLKEIDVTPAATTKPISLNAGSAPLLASTAPAKSTASSGLAGTSLVPAMQGVAPQNWGPRSRLPRQACGAAEAAGVVTTDVKLARRHWIDRRTMIVRLDVRNIIVRFEIATP